MSYNASKPNVSAPVAEDVDLREVVHAIIDAAGPGVIKSVVIAAGLFDPQLSGVVLDPTEPGGGYLVEHELAQGITYIVLGVGKGAGSQEPGIFIVPANNGTIIEAPPLPQAE